MDFLQIIQDQNNINVLKEGASIDINDMFISSEEKKKAEEEAEEIYGQDDDFED